MHTTVRHYEGVTNTGEVVRQIKEEGFLDVIREVPGFVNYNVVDAGGGTLVTISVFEDQSGAEESNNRAAEWIQQHNLGSLIPNRPQITAGEVVVHERA
jgi:hypothetical protein